MELNFVFFFNSILLGIGLAADAFSVSLANGLNEPKMSIRKTFGCAGIFAFFQALMPLIGWFCVHTIAEYFTGFQKLIPWLALGLLGFIGGKMIYDSRCEDGVCYKAEPVTFVGLLVQGVATSIDALSVGFTIASYNTAAAALSALIIGIVTFAICLAGLYIGKKAGNHLAGKAGTLGGVILIIIGLEIFITNLLGI